MWKSAALCGLMVFFAVVRGDSPASCNSLQNDTAGTLLSPKYPFTVETPQTCKWTFDVKNVPYIYLMIDQADLGTLDQLIITDGVEFHTYDGSVEIRDVLFVLSPSNSSVEFIVKDNNTSTPRRFMASYSADPKKNRHLTIEDQGVIQSPIVLKPSATPIHFEWIITQKPGSNVHMSFKHFNLTNGTLIVNNGQSDVNLTGHIMPNDVIGQSNVKLTLDWIPTDVNCSFWMSFSQYQFNCSYTIQVTDTHVVQFPMLHTSDRVKCLVIVESPQDSVLTAALTLDEDAQSYPHALLLINDGGSRYSPNLLVFPTTSRSAASDVLSSGNRLWIEYMCNAEERTPEVNVTLSIFNNRSSSLVGKGIFNVTSLPTNVTLASNSSAFMLTVDSDEQVVVTLTNASLAPGKEILLYDGASRDQLLATFTENTSLYQVPSTGSQMMVVANDFTGNDTFFASFVAAVKGCNVLSNGSFGSYHLSSIGENSTCFWNIVPSNGSASSVISLTINQLNLKPGMTLTVFNGAQETASVAYTATSNVSSAITVHVPSATGARLLVNNTGKETSDLIVDATYIILEDCNVVVDVTNSTEVQSPFYPNAFPVNVHCVMNFTSSSFLLFHMDDVHLSVVQPLVFYRNGSVVANVSGDADLEDIILASPVILQWNSTATYNTTLRERFRMTVCPIDIGGVYNGTVKEFATPGFPKKVDNSTKAVWSIRASDKTKILSLKIATGDIATGASKLQFYDGGSVLPSAAVNMSAVNMSDYLTRTNELTVEYSYVQDKTGGTPYKITYDEIVCKTYCGNKVCLHDVWRCNGVNDCGDNTDELNCTAQPIINSTTTGVPVATLVAMIFVMFILGVAFTLAAPFVLKRVRSSQSNYQEFHNTAEA